MPNFFLILDTQNSTFALIPSFSKALSYLQPALEISGPKNFLF